MRIISSHLSSSSFQKQAIVGEGGGGGEVEGSGDGERGGGDVGNQGAEGEDGGSCEIEAYEQSL